MSVHLKQADTACQVAVLGRQLAQQDVQQLSRLLAGEACEGTQAPGGGALELSFYDADGLPSELLEAICARLDRGETLTVIAYHALLAHRLSRLGVPVRQAARPPALRPLPPCRALLLGGSAQSLDKLLAIVEALPLADVAVFVVQHVQEDQANLLDQLLKSRTEYRVLMPHALCPIEARTIYVAPPGHQMKLAHGLVYLTRDARVQYARPSVDVLFESAALEFGDAALAVLLCGYGHDGLQGCARLRDRGGVVLAEDGEDCGDARVMPDAVRDAGHCDQVLRLPALISVLGSAVAGDRDEPEGERLQRFLQALQAYSGQDYSGYQRESLERRVRNQMGQLGLRRFSDFQRALFSDSQIYERFSAELPVGVTSFFRHPAQLREIRDKVLPVLQSFPVVKLWCAGCSSGEEPFSLAVMLEEAGLAERSHCFATDLNPYQLEAARGGLYPVAVQAESLRNYQASGGLGRLDAYLLRQGRLLHIAPRLQQRVLFYRHSLADEGIFNEFQLIICRNVLIYFSEALQRLVLQRFKQSLHVDGFLILGPQDGLQLMARELGFVPIQKGSSIYRSAGRA